MPSSNRVVTQSIPRQDYHECMEGDLADKDSLHGSISVIGYPRES